MEEITYPTKWKSWFAWKPVRFNNKTVFMSRMRRRQLYVWVLDEAGNIVDHTLGWQYKHKGVIGTDPLQRVSDTQIQLELVKEKSGHRWRNKID
jgi:hypothetical protein